MNSLVICNYDFHIISDKYCFVCSFYCDIRIVCLDFDLYFLAWTISSNVYYV